MIMFVLMKIFSNPFCYNSKVNGGVGEINFGKQYRQGNRIYSSAKVATCLTAEPLGNTGGYTSLYMIKKDNENE